MTPEEKRRLRAALDSTAKKLIEDGRVVEVGWMIFRKYFIHPDAPEYQLKDMRVAFLTGAQHIWGCMFSVFEPGEEPTDEDLKRVDAMAREMEDVKRELVQTAPINGVD